MLRSPGQRDGWNWKMLPAEKRRPRLASCVSSLPVRRRESAIRVPAGLGRCERQRDGRFPLRVIARLPPAVAQEDWETEARKTSLLAVMDASASACRLCMLRGRLSS